MTQAMVAWEESFSSNVLSVTLNLAVTEAPGKRVSRPSRLITHWKKEGGVLNSLAEEERVQLISTWRGELPAPSHLGVACKFLTRLGQLRVEPSC